ncbi:uncharacterized protein F5Z01DRAFT_669293 [Emericellopsis atlantica]|uniref:C2H2-type domain-containing protein n=1 Tax=Emericellopsis atlantica TaxID=2614577 RepID=A0A9P7ZCU6_9HYPO|nr:uncharacterized protein F5Z01DRAFT_669293 [Emericellopsis atlantica]KAG9249411.1 hypothetical protein F5Z01DRAFT_669293 [Emericellopsis atlantica]
MATTSRVERLLETVRSQEREDRANRDRVGREIARLGDEIVGFEGERVDLDARLKKHKAFKSKLEVHAASKSQLESAIAQLDAELREQRELYCDSPDGTSSKKFYQVSRPLIAQYEEKLKCVRNLDGWEQNLVDEIDAENIYLPESTPFEDGSGDIDRGEDTGVGATDDRPQSVGEQAADGLPRPSPPNPRSQNKRRLSQRKDTPRKVSRLTERTIDIDTFFQNGKSKHRIFRVNGDGENWWIVWCKEHNMTFGTKNSLTGAGKHLNSNRHGGMDKSHETALAHLGYKVLNCTPQMVDANNRAVDAELETCKSHAPHKNRERTTLSSGGDDAEADFVPKAHVKKPMKRRGDTASQAVLDPKPGYIYRAWISQNFRAVICLPLPPTVEATGIVELQAQTEDLVKEMETEPPVCYSERNGKFVWAEDYEDHGPKVQERQYPVVVINNGDRTKWTRAWIPANDLAEVEQTDPSLQFIANRNAVLAELRRRKNLEKDQSGPATGMHRAARVAPIGNFADSHAPPRAREDVDEVPSDDLLSCEMVAENARGQDGGSPVAELGKQQTSDVQDTGTSDRSRGGSALSVTIGPKVEMSVTGQIAESQSAFGAYSSMHDSTTSEPMDTDRLVGVKSGNLTPTDKAPPLVSMKIAGLLNSPEVLPSSADVVRDFLRDIARDALPSTERDLEYHTSKSRDARPNVSYYNGHHEATMGAESTTHHQTVDSATTERTAKSLSTSSASPLELKCSQCGITYREQSAFDKHMETHIRPFICVFHYAGCNKTFSKKNEWKRHVLKQHICLKYYHCDYMECATTTRSGTTCRANKLPARGKIFRRKDLYMQHVRRMHLSKINARQDQEAVAELQQRALRTRCQLPLNMACPAEHCNLDFRGDKAWDDWMEHAARHLLAAHERQEPEVGFGGSQDTCLTEWAEHPDVDVARRVQGGWALNDPLQDCDEVARSSPSSNICDEDAEEPA